MKTTAIILGTSRSDGNTASLAKEIETKTTHFILIIQERIILKEEKLRCNLKYMEKNDKFSLNYLAKFENHQSFPKKSKRKIIDIKVRF